MLLVRHFYVSRIAPGVTDVDVQMILGMAQMNNRRRDLTGMLALSDDHFAQVLEGRAEAVQALMSRIRRDPRHLGVHTLLAEPIRQRQFASWAMRLVRRDDLREALRNAHAQGCADGLDARRLLQALVDHVS